MISGARKRLGWLAAGFRALLREAPRRVEADDPVSRPAQVGVTHIVLLDGTMSALSPGDETNVGLMFHLLKEVEGLSLYYEPGLQWRGWARAGEVVAGVGINRQIRRAYMFLARRYKPGDRIMLVGYSRGAYAVRALAGLIDRLGLMRAEAVTPANVEQIYRHYYEDPSHPAARSFAAKHCHARTQIEGVFVFDTVRAIGTEWPLLWALLPKVQVFTSDVLGQRVKRGFQALALHETRKVFKPSIWRVPAHRLDAVQQVWFRGSHGIVGGQLNGFHEARVLSNIPLVWMLRQMEACGVHLPDGWAERYPRDGDAPVPVGYRGAGHLLLHRGPRKIGSDPSEALHIAAVAHTPSRFKGGLPIVGCLQDKADLASCAAEG